MTNSSKLCKFGLKLNTSLWIDGAHPQLKGCECMLCQCGACILRQNERGNKAFGPIVTYITAIAIHGHLDSSAYNSNF